MAKQYLTFEAIDSGTFVYYSRQYEYSFDGVTWVSCYGDTPTVQAGQIIMFRATETSGQCSTFASTGRFNAYGDIRSIYEGENFGNTEILQGGYQRFSELFLGCEHLISAEGLILNVMGDSCCESMFSICTSMTTAPSTFPVTTLDEECYYNMFYGCTSLVNPPQILPSTDLALCCYDSMFHNCTSLTKAPMLPATILANSCYDSMFEGCPINYIICLATDVSQSPCDKWLSGCAKTGTFVKNHQITVQTWNSNYSGGIPPGWNVEDYVLSLSILIPNMSNNSVTMNFNNTTSMSVLAEFLPGVSDDIIDQVTITTNPPGIITIT